MLTPDENPWEIVCDWLEAASLHPMVGYPYAHTMLIDVDSRVTVTLRLWQWIECEHGDERQWLLRAVEDPGTTATGHIAVALANAYHAHEQRWGPDSPGWEYANSVDEALQLDTYQSTKPPVHPYVIPRCNSGPC